MKHGAWVLAAGMVLAVPDAAWATQGSTGTISGSICRKQSSGGTLLITSSGSAMNDHADDPLTIDCPIFSAASGKSWGTHADERISYVDDLASSNVSCTLVSEDNNSTSTLSVGFESNTNDGNPHFWTVPPLATFANGHGHLRCSIPPKDAAGNRSGIRGFYIDDDRDPDGEPSESTLGYYTTTGSNCRSDGNLRIRSDGAVFNDDSGSTNLLWIHCPVLQAYPPSNPSVPTYTRANTKIWYMDNSPGAVTCSLKAVNSDTSSSFTRTFASTAEDTSYRSFDFSGTDQVTPFNGGWVYYQCRMPGKNSNGNLSALIMGNGYVDKAWE